MIRAELQKLDQSPRALRNFGVLVGGVLLAFAAVGFWRSRGWWPWAGGPGFALTALGVLAPRSLRRLHLGWMALAFVLGTVMGSVLLTLVYFLAVTPIGWLARWRGKDFLRRRPAPVGGTYWLPRDRLVKPARADYERQF